MEYINLNVNKETKRVATAVIDLILQAEKRRPTVERLELTLELAAKMNEK